MKRARAAVVIMFAFLFGGSSAEVAVQAKRAIDRHLAAEEEGSVGDLIALEVRDAAGELVARPRLIAAPGKPAQLELRDPEQPWHIRVLLRVVAQREASGDLALTYELALPRVGVHSRGEVVVTPGVEQALDLGELSASVFSVPVPSAAFEAYLASEREARVLAVRERS
jgi:hypothetical protein